MRLMSRMITWLEQLWMWFTLHTCSGRFMVSSSCCLPSSPCPPSSLSHCPPFSPSCLSTFILSPPLTRSCCLSAQFSLCSTNTRRFPLYLLSSLPQLSAKQTNKQTNKKTTFLAPWTFAPDWESHTQRDLAQRDLHTDKCILTSKLFSFVWHLWKAWMIALAWLRASCSRWSDCALAERTAPVKQ